jgi:hypothetical protein
VPSAALALASVQASLAVVLLELVLALLGLLVLEQRVFSALASVDSMSSFAWIRIQGFFTFNSIHRG